MADETLFFNNAREAWAVLRDTRLARRLRLRWHCFWFEWHCHQPNWDQNKALYHCKAKNDLYDWKR